MLIRFSQTIGRIATPSNALLFLISLLPFIYIFFPWRSNQLSAIAGYRPRLLDTRLLYTPQEVHLLASDLDKTGQWLYAVTEVTLDFAFPVLYATWLSIIIVLVWRKERPEWAGWMWLALLPYVGMLADFGENTCIASMMLLFPKEPIWLVWLSNLSSLVKWTAGIGSLGIILVGLGVCMVKFFGYRNR